MSGFTDHLSRRLHTPNGSCLTVALVIWLAAAVGPPADADVIERVGGWPYGPTLAVDVDTKRDLIFASSGGAVLILDGIDRTNPVIVSDDVRSAGLVRDVFYDADDQNLYLACDEAGLEIWSVADPSTPQQLSQLDVLYFDVAAPVRNVDVHGDCALLECSWGYVHSVNVSDPNNPVQVAFNGVMGNPARDLYVSSDGQIHSSGAQRYQRIEVLPGGSLNSSGSRDYDFGPSMVYGTADVAYVAYNQSLEILDLHHPAFAPWSIQPVGGILDIVVQDGIAYIVNGTGFNVWDVSVHTDPSWVGTLFADWNPRKLTVAGGYAYVGTSRDGLRIIEIGDGTAPVEVGSYETLGPTSRAEILGDVAYLAHSGDGLVTVDISDPSRPETLGQLDTPDEARDIAIVYPHLYLADISGGLRVIDITDPAAPLEVGVLDDYHVWRVDASGDRAVAIESIVNESYWLHVLDVSDPTAPVELGARSMLARVTDVELAGEYAFVAADDRGLRVVDISDPSSPLEVGHYPAPDLFGIRVRGDRAFLAAPDWSGGFIILDVSDPTDPTLLARYNPSGWFHPFHVEVVGSFAYLGVPQGAADIVVFDISDPTDPIELQTVHPPGDEYALRAVGEYLYVSDGEAGVQIYRNDAVVGVHSVPAVSRPGGIVLTAAPNPFTPSTAFHISAPTSLAAASLVLVDAAGREVRRIALGRIPAGETEVVWDGRNSRGADLPAGVYFYRVVHADGQSAAGRAMLVR